MTSAQIDPRTIPGLTTTKAPFIEQAQAKGELYIEQGRQRPFLVDSVTAPRAQLGLRYTPAPAVDIDFVYGHNITGRGGDWFTLGLTMRTP